MPSSPTTPPNPLSDYGYADDAAIAAALQADGVQVPLTAPISQVEQYVTKVSRAAKLVGSISSRWNSETGKYIIKLRPPGGPRT